MCSDGPSGEVTLGSVNELLPSGWVASAPSRGSIWEAKPAKDERISRSE